MSVRVDAHGLSVRLGGSPVLREIDFHVEPGELLTLLGPSGSGKTTALNVIAGFVTQDAGHVALDGEVIDGLTPQQRQIGFVFQDYALFPHMTVSENIAFPLRVRGIDRRERRRIVAEMLELVRLPDRGKDKVGVLSGGQRQRVAFARALGFSPRLVLLDEPLSALDRQLREAMQTEVKRIQREFGVTAIAVTHDQSEAFTMSDRIAIVNDGCLEQIGEPRELYRRPANLFVARFLGEANLLSVDAHGNLHGFEMRLSARGAGTAVLRPEDLQLRECGGTGDGACAAEVEDATFQGARLRVVVRPLDARLDRLLIALPAHVDPGAVAPGSRVTVAVAGDRVHVIEGVDGDVLAADPVLEPEGRAL